MYHLVILRNNVGAKAWSLMYAAWSLMDTAGQDICRRLIPSYIRILLLLQYHIDIARLVLAKWVGWVAGHYGSYFALKGDRTGTDVVQSTKVISTPYDQGMNKPNGAFVCRFLLRKWDFLLDSSSSRGSSDFIGLPLLNLTAIGYAWGLSCSQILGESRYL
nr:hypothetical protein [Tanacetum cinerariifolium]